jgi:hypothetical protein
MVTCANDTVRYLRYLFRPNYHKLLFFVLHRKHADELGEYKLVGETAGRPVYQHLSKKLEATTKYIILPLLSSVPVYCTVFLIFNC